MRKILIAPDSFKGSLSASKITKVIDYEFGKSKLSISVNQLPLADGGEGSLEAIQKTRDLKQEVITVFDPLMKEVEAIYLVDVENDIAYIELAQASRLKFTQDQPDIMNSTTFGTGQLIRHAIENGAKKIVLFIGGSATNDAGLGILEALGYRFYDLHDQIRPLPVNMDKIVKIDDKESILNEKNIDFTIAADVTNPFYGTEGAAYVYAAQKGANKKEIKQLNAGLVHLAGIFLKNHGCDVQHIAGAGAAGGVGGGLCSLVGAKIVSGARLIFDLLNVEGEIQKADIIISGEGKIDYQSLNNKLLYNISALAKKYNKVLWVVCGYFEGDKNLQKELGISKIFSMAKTKSEIPEAMRNTEDYLKEIADKIIKALFQE